MSHDWIADINFFEQLCAEDARVAATLKGSGCLRCGGRLDRADYPRKPRGGMVGVAGEGLERRLSFCCSRDGCRRRATPPSLVFLGRRVYLGIVVVVETLRLALVSAAAPSPSPARRTVRRWRTWFAALRSSAWCAALSGRLWPPVGPSESLPQALVDRLASDRGLTDALAATLRFLSPLSTTTAD